MQWTAEAEQLMERVPIFVRRFAKKKVEDYVRSQNREIITVEDVYAVKGKDGKVEINKETSVKDENEIKEISKEISVKKDEEKEMKKSHKEISIQTDGSEIKNKEIFMEKIDEKNVRNENNIKNKEKTTEKDSIKDEIEISKDAKFKERGIELTEEKIREIEKIAESERIFKGRFYEVKLCGGAVGCPLTLFDVDEIGKKIKDKINEEKLEEFLAQRIKVALSHHRFKVSISGCPNACSQPQIVDFGIIGKSIVKVVEGKCVGCMKCVKACKENCIEVKKIDWQSSDKFNVEDERTSDKSDDRNAIEDSIETKKLQSNLERIAIINGNESMRTLSKEGWYSSDKNEHSSPNKWEVKIDYGSCVGCRDCVVACSKSAIIEEEILNRILIGGKLGRHPKLAIEIEVCNDEKTLKILEKCIKLVKENNGERVGNIVAKIGNVKKLVE